ncbi:MAG: hypothetical protein EBT13_03170 [Rhodobacteraceae bacterium]|nr:hypothetical protein [Paracoccaceae bacterium]
MLRHRELPVVLAVAAKVDPGFCQRQARLGHQRRPRPLESTQVTLPLDRFRRPLRVLGKLVANLADQQRWHVDQHHPYRLGLAVTSRDRTGHRAVHPTITAGEHHLVHLASGCRLVSVRYLVTIDACPAANHVHSPGRSYVRPTVLA